MARLPCSSYIIQQSSGIVYLENDIGNVIVQFDPADADATAKAQKVIYDSEELNDEQKCFAHFWSGYFYARAI